jgi:transposase-like protein
MRSKLERRQVPEETLRPAAPSVAIIARAHGVNANQVFNWRKLYRWIRSMSSCLVATRTSRNMVGVILPEQILHKNLVQVWIGSGVTVPDSRPLAPPDERAR